MTWTDRGLFVRPGDRSAPFGLTHRIHFVGIGGIGMAGIAEVLLHLGFDVRGSDRSESLMTQRLRDLGAQIFVGHDAAHVGDADVVVFSSAVPADNPELEISRQQGIPIIRRAEMLAELMRLKHGIAVAGSHGKTTTASLIAQILVECGLDPTVIVGGRLLALGGTAILGQGQYLVAEADESDGTFLRLTPTMAVVTNVDREHLDHYKDMDAIRDAFVDFMDRVPFYGQVIACTEDVELQRLLHRGRWPAFTYGFGPENHLRVAMEDINPQGMRLRFWREGEALGAAHLPLLGRHNALNATAAVACALQLGVEFQPIATALASFGGVGRRLEIRGEVGGVLVVDDYGHHPTELAVTLEALRSGFDRRLGVIFQPHRYTRTRDHYSEFADVLASADLVGLLPIYEASETPIVGVNSELIARRLRDAHGVAAHMLTDLDDAVQWVKSQAQPGDLWLTQGAGDITRLADRLVQGLGGQA